jgi:hypothetical protein
MLCGGFPECRINVPDALAFLEKSSARITERAYERLYFFTHSRDIEYTLQDTLDAFNQWIQITTAVAEKLSD